MLKTKINFILIVILFLASCSYSHQEIPFVKQEGSSCMQAQMAMVLNYYGYNYTLKDMEKLSQRKKDKWTWTSQVFQILSEKELNVEYYSTTPYFLINKTNLYSIYGEDAKIIEKVTDWDLFYQSIGFLMDNPQYHNQKLTWDKIEEYYYNKYLLVMIIDLNRLYQKSGYGGHGVTITKIDKEYVYFHNSIGTPNQKAKKQDFIDAWNANGTDNDVLVIRGRK